MQEKITADHEYWNEVHYKWFSVPPHWIGLSISEVGYPVYLFTPLTD